MTTSMEQTTDRRRWLILATIVAAQFMVILDVAIVNVALPSIKADLREQHPRRRRVANRRANRLSGGDLTRCHAETLANNQYLTREDRFL